MQWTTPTPNPTLAAQAVAIVRHQKGDAEPKHHNAVSMVINGPEGPCIPGGEDDSGERDDMQGGEGVV